MDGTRDWRIVLFLGGVLSSSVLYRLAFPPVALGALAWVCLVPLLRVIRGSGPLRSLGAGALFGAGHAVLHAMGLYQATTALFDRPWYAGAAVGGVLAPGYFGFWAGLACAGGALLHRQLRWGFAPAIATAWLLGDLLHVRYGALPWTLLGASQASIPVLLQVAELGGAPTSGAFVVLVNALLTEAMAAHERRRGVLVAAAGGVLASVALFGLIRVHQVDAGGTASLRVALVQPVFRHARFLEERPVDVARLRRLVQASFEAGADVVLVPETAGGPLDAVEDRVGPVPPGRYVMAGVTEGWTASELGGAGGGRNLAVWIDSESGLRDSRYAKRRLFPVGEARILGLERLVLSREDAHRSRWVQSGPDSPAVFSGAGWRVAPLICFELLFPDVVRASADTHPHWLAVLSNDEWFATSSEPLQHHAETALVAVQTRRPVARATNTGVSGGFDAAGRPVPVDVYVWPERLDLNKGIGSSTERASRAELRPLPPETGRTQVPPDTPAVGLLSLDLGAVDPVAAPRTGWWLLLPLTAWGFASERRSHRA